MPKKTNPNFMNGVPELLILRLLSETEMYGYELVQAIHATSSGAISLGEGVVYPVLHALERDGALKSKRRPVGGRTRVYYTVTPKGKKRLSGIATEWSRITDAVADILKGESHAASV